MPRQYRHNTQQTHDDWKIRLLRWCCRRWWASSNPRTIFQAWWKQPDHQWTDFLRQQKVELHMLHKMIHTTDTFTGAVTLRNAVSIFVHLVQIYHTLLHNPPSMTKHRQQASWRMLPPRQRYMHAHHVHMYACTHRWTYAHRRMDNLKKMPHLMH